MSASTDDRLLYLLKSRGPQTAGDAAEMLGISTPGAQQKLAKLAATNLAEYEDRKQKRGRPKRYWRLTEKGHARFPDRHSDLTLELLNSTKEIFGEAGLERLIKHRERETLDAYRSEMADCRNTEDRIAALAAIRTREGYMATWERREGNTYLLIENHCPVCAAARACQGLCRAELDIFRAVLGPDMEVTRTDHILAGARRCAYEIRLLG